MLYFYNKKRLKLPLVFLVNFKFIVMFIYKLLHYDKLCNNRPRFWSSNKQALVGHKSELVECKQVVECKQALPVLHKLELDNIPVEWGRLHNQ